MFAARSSSRALRIVAGKASVAPLVSRQTAALHLLPATRGPRNDNGRDMLVIGNGDDTPRRISRSKLVDGDVRRLLSSLRGAAKAGPPTLEEDKAAVAATTRVWIATVTSGTPDAPEKTTALYAPDGILVGTVSEQVRDTPDKIHSYFEFFARLPGLRVIQYTPDTLQVYGDFAIQAGTYTFAYDADGKTVERPCRFSFTFKRDLPESPTPWTIIEHHSSLMPQAPPGLKHVLREPEITPDMKAVADATILWKDTVTSNTDDAPKKTAALYAPDAVFWGTVSEQVRVNPQHFSDYFEFFARLPNLRLTEYSPAPTKVYGDFGIQTGIYTFAWEGADGKTVEKQCRFSFAFKKNHPAGTREWTLVHHHSSLMPQAPPGLKPVGGAAPVSQPVKEPSSGLFSFLGNIFGKKTPA